MVLYTQAMGMYLLRFQETLTSVSKDADSHIKAPQYFLPASSLLTPGCGGQMVSYLRSLTQNSVSLDTKVHTSKENRLAPLLSALPAFP